MTTSGKILLKQGGHIAYQQWGKHNHKKLFAVHGWLDNSNSFNYLGPHLANHGYNIFAIDLIGHGRSYHFNKDASYNFLAYLSSIREIMDSIGWSNTSIIGHSMGASVVSTFAATYPERINTLVMIDGFGPFTRPASKSLSVIRQRIEFDIKIAHKKTSPRKAYPSLSDAIKARMENVKNFPGQQFISQEAAHALVSRGVQLVGDGVDDNVDVVDLGTGPVVFRHDLGLMRPLYYYLTNEQALAIMQGIACPALVISAEFGWPPGDPIELAERRKILDDKKLVEFHEIKGASHHLHLDPKNAPAVAEMITTFLNKTSTMHVDKPIVVFEPLEFAGE